MPSVEIVLDNRVRVVGELPKELVSAMTCGFEHNNPAHAKLRAMGYAVYKEPRVIKTWVRERDGSLSFPRGGMQRVREALRAGGYSWTVSDQRADGAEELDAEYVPFFGEPAAYQLAAVEALHKRENGLLRLPTSGRKTSIGMMLAARARVPTLILVDQTALAEQWIERVVLELGIPEGQIGRIWGGEFRLRPVTVGMHASVLSRAKKPEDRRRMLQYFGCVIGDEIQIAAAARAYEAFDLFPARRRYGISADEARADRKEFLTYDLFGSAAFEVEREELVRQGVILDVEIRVVETAFEAPWYGGDGAGAEDYDFNRLLDEMQVDDGRNALAYEVVLEELAAGEQAVVLAHRRDHCRILDAGFAARGVKSGFLIGGEDYAAEFEQTRLGLRGGEVRVGVGTIKSIGQGIDMPSVGIGVVATPLAANKQRFNQARGRLCRKPPGKTRAVMYYLLDPRVGSYANHLKNIVAWNPTVTVREGERWVPAKESGLWRRVHERKSRALPFG